MKRFPKGNTRPMWSIKSRWGVFYLGGSLNCDFGDFGDLNDWKCLIFEKRKRSLDQLRRPVFAKTTLRRLGLVGSVSMVNDLYKPG